MDEAKKQDLIADLVSVRSDIVEIVNTPRETPEAVAAFNAEHTVSSLIAKGLTGVLVCTDALLELLDES